MQFEINKQILLKAISNVNGAVEKKNTIPVLQNIKIESNSSSNQVILSATDMDIVITSSFLADIKNSGSTTVPAQMFFDIVRKIPDGSLVVSNDTQSILTIKSGRSKYNLPCIDSSEFPSLSEVDSGQEIEIESEALAKMIDKTRFAISNEETRYYLNGLYLHSYKKDSGFELRTVATDGHRLALSFFETNLESDFGIIIPKKSVAEIRKIIENSTKIKILVSRVKIKIIADQTTIISKLIDGEFPDYTKLLPKNNSHVAIVNKKNFFDCVDRVFTVSADKNRSVKISVENGKMTLQSSNNNDGSYAYEELDISYSGDKIETGFNSKYLMDIISQIDNDEVIIRFKDSFSPAIIETKNLNAVFIIMPMRI